jgi:hypothetical protein
MLFPDEPNREQHRKYVLANLRLMEEIGEEQARLLSYYKHLKHEEQFFARLERLVGANWGDAKLRGARETKQMFQDLCRWERDIMLREDQAIERRLHLWLKCHPGVKFIAYGLRGRRSARRLWRQWRMEARATKRRFPKDVKTEKLVRVWRMKYDKRETIMAHQNRIKRKAKWIRRVTLEQASIATEKEEAGEILKKTQRQAYP